MGTNTTTGASTWNGHSNLEVQGQFDRAARVLPERIAGELCLGYLSRCAEGMSLGEIRHFHRSLRQDVGLADDKSTGRLPALRLLCDQLSGMPAHQGRLFGGASYAQLDTREWSRYANAWYPRLCPACWEEGTYFRIPWAIKLVTACPRHGRGLIELQFGGGRPVTWGNVLSEPQWTNKARFLQSQRASNEELAIAEVIEAGLLGSGLSIARRLGLSPDITGTSQSLLSILRIVHVMGALSIEADRSWLQLDPTASRIEECRRGVEGAAAALARWPHGLGALIDRLHKRYSRVDGTYRQGDLLGDAYRLLKSEFDGGAASVLRSDDDRTTMKGVLWRYIEAIERTGKGRAGGALVRIEQAGRILGLFPRTVGKLVETGQLRGVEVEGRGKCATVALFESDLCSFMSLRGLLIAESVFSVELGVPLSHVRTYCTKGLLAATDGTPRPGAKSSLMDLGQLKHLEERLNALVHPTTTLVESASSRRVSSVMREMGVEHTGDFLRAILSGAVRIERADTAAQRLPLFSRYAIEPGTTRKWVLDSMRGKEFLTTWESATWLEVDVDQVGALIRKGTLSAKRQLKRGRWSWLVPIAEASKLTRYKRGESCL